MTVRRAWDSLDWDQPIIDAEFVIPEAHYGNFEQLGLSITQRLQLNRLLTCFTCELFIHFEHYVVRYLQRYPQRFSFLSDRAVARFVREEQVHIRAFERLLGCLRPDLYESVHDGVRVQFLSWSHGDNHALRLAPVGTFFVLAWLFEEITLFVPQAFEGETSRSELVQALMQLHAQEERGHVAIDRYVLEHLKQNTGAVSAYAQTVLALPLLAYVDRRVAAGWKQLVRQATRELGLNKAQRRALALRAPTQSDRLGMESFGSKMRAFELPGSKALCWGLEQALR